jgi:ribosomal protein S21
MAVKLICNDEEPIENTLRRFKRSINQSGHLMTARHKEMWETAADKKKRKAESAKFLNRFLD